jgi:hypothetical protein
LNIREIEAQAKALAPVLKKFVADALATFRGDFEKSLDIRDEQLRSAVSESLDGVLTDLSEVAAAAAALIEKPNNGKDADPDLVRQLIVDEVAKLPVPQDGKSCVIEDIQPLIAEQVTAAVNALPVPLNGMDADPEVIRLLIIDEVAKLPVPQDGKSVSVDELVSLVDEQVQVAVGRLPPAQPGKNADHEVLIQAIAAEVAKLPAPENGTSVSVEELRPLIVEELAKAVGNLPAPKDGVSIALEDIQHLVDTAVARRMESIVLPKNGEPGRDAAHIEILPAIEIEKAYPRGTYAKHLGGLWRSYEATSSLKGWECIVEGVASMSVEQDGERGFKAVAQMSSGRFEEKSMILPVMIYRGVFVGGHHQPGDTVTWGGSLWHCDFATNEKPGEPGSKGWRLAVKKGRDGKDGNHGKDLIKGVSIK